MQRLRVEFRNQADGKDYACGLKVEPNEDMLRNRVSELVPGAAKADYEKKKAIDGSFLLLGRSEQLKWFKEKAAKANKEPGTKAKPNG